jgi:two-component system NtrC family sensor kinase
VNRVKASPASAPVAPSAASASSPGSGQAGSSRLPRVQSGLRLQIVLALAGLMILAFVPLFFAVASLTRATILGAREQAARLVGRAIAAHVAGAGAREGEGVESAIAKQVGTAGVDAVCVFASDGAAIACGGAASEVAEIRAEANAANVEPVERVRGAAGHTLEVVAPAGEHSMGGRSATWTVVARVNVDAAADRGPPLVRLVALYMIVFALALLVFAYFSLTRLIVRPVEHLVDAADRVANGARTLRVRRGGARELAELGASVQAMAEKLISEEATLILKVEELTDTTKRLTDTRAQLVRSERMASVGRLAAGLAHEIGNPIAALMGMEDLLLEEDLDPDAQRDFLRRMRKETDRIHLVVRDLLDFARPEGTAATEAGPPAPANVRAVVDDVVALVRPQKLFRAVRVETEAAASLEVALQASKLTQVLLNLVLNAGAAIVGAQRETGRVVVRARPEGAGRIRIEVEDDGPGVATDVRDRLFEPFVTTKPVGEGTGLGLAVCRGLVESAGGEIGLDPSHEGGARFYLILPAP